MATTVEELYKEILGRAPDAAGLANWQAAFGSTIDPNEVSMFRAAAAPELAMRQPTAAAPVTTPQQNFASTVPQTASDPLVQRALNALQQNPIQYDPNSLIGPIERGTRVIDDSMLRSQQQAAQAASQPLQVASGTGAYGFVNGAPVLNGNQLRQLLGGEMSAAQTEDYGLMVGDTKGNNARFVPSSQADTLGWNLSSKWNGTIKTGAALHGVEGSVTDLKSVLAAEDAYNNALRAAGGNTEAVNRSAFFQGLMGDPDTGGGASTAYTKLNDNVSALKTAAQQLGIDPNLPLTQLLDQVNQKETRVAVTGRTNSWGTNAPGGGGDKGHAAVIYTPDASGRLVASSDIETFDASDPRRGGLSGPAKMAIGAALTTFGAPYLANGLSAMFPGMSSVASQAIARGLVNGAATGVITGDVESALLAGIASGAGSYAMNSGVLGDVMNRIGLGETASQFNIPTTGQVTAAGGPSVSSFVDSFDSPANQQYWNNLIQGGNPANAALTNLMGDPSAYTNVDGMFANPALTGAGVVGAGAAGAGAAGAAGTAAGRGIIDALTNPNNLTSLLTGGANAAINWAALNEAAQQASETGNMLQNAATAMGQASNVPFTPYTVTTGGGMANVSPNAATTLASMPYQQIRGAAQQQALQALGAINPATASETMFGRMEALAAPTRERDQVAMQERLARQGLLGFGSNQPTVGGTTRTINPLMESLLSAQETGRAQQALASTQFGSTEAQRMQQIAAGLQNQALGIDNLEQSMLGSATNLSNLQNQLGQSNATRQLQSSLYGLGLRSGLEQEALANRMAGITGLARAGTGIVNNQQTQNALSGLFSDILNRYIL
jgi:hypothetical protein